MTTDTTPPIITRFGQILPDGAVPLLLKWAEARPGDLVLMDGSMGLAEDVQTGLCDWGHGTQFIRTDVSWRLDNGHIVSSEFKGDDRTCIIRAGATDVPPLAEDWAAWLQDATVDAEARCGCSASPFRPHPLTAGHGHPDGQPACPECHGSGLSWLKFDKMPCLLGCAYRPLYWSEREALNGLTS